MKIATCNEFFENWKIEDVFRYVAEVGYDGVEVAPFTLARSVSEIDAERRRALSRAAEETGIEIVGLHWLLVSPEGLYINHPDERIRRVTQDYFQELIRFCGDIGGHVMIIGSPKQRSVQPGWSPETVWDLTKETFYRILPVAEECHVTLCIEALSADQTNFITTVRDAVRMVEQIDHPNLRTMVDVRSGSREEIPVPELIKHASPYLRHVHVNDANGRGPSFGSTDFGPILQTLKDLNYDGYISVEVFDFTPDPRTIAAKSLGYLQGVLSQRV
jgi:sugar phosphate isomerase/epimerase